MKRYKSSIAAFFFLVFILLPLCFLAAFYSITPFLEFADVSYAVVAYLIISMSGIILFILLLPLLSIWHHKCNKEQSHHKFYADIQKALDKIAKGDFGVTIDMNQYQNHKGINLAEKVNTMAKELSGMETMRQDFVSNVSHEIQSPLTSIRGFVTLLRNENLSKEERLHYIDVIETESLRLSKLSDNLLKLTTLDSEYALFHPKRYLLNKQLKDTILLLEPQWNAKSIEVSIDDESVEVSADEDLFSQVWINLLHNSIKFTPEGGNISISVSKEKKEVKVTISDNGIGMKTEEVTHIFERFYMVDKSRSSKAGGSGLGLSIVKRIVEIQHGSIDVQSQPSKGTVFSVKIPIN